MLDEPTDGLDPQGIREVRALLPRLRDELGLTILLCSHLLSEVERVCNRVAIIDEGHLLYQGKTGDLIGKDRVIRITADPLEKAYQLLVLDPALSVSRNGSQSLHVKMPDERIPHVNARLVEHGIRVKELSVERATLEDVFLTLTSETLVATEPRAVTTGTRHSPQQESLNSQNHLR